MTAPAGDETEPLLRRFLASHPQFQGTGAWDPDPTHPAFIWLSRAGCHAYARWAIVHALGTAEEQAVAAALLQYLDTEGD